MLLQHWQFADQIGVNLELHLQDPDPVDAIWVFHGAAIIPYA